MGILANTGTQTLSFGPTGNNRIDIAGLFLSGDVTVAHFIIFSIQLIMELGEGATGETLTVFETFEINDLTVTQPMPTVAPVPVPASAPLFGAGLVVMLALRRRKPRAA